MLSIFHVNFFFKHEGMPDMPHLAERVFFFLNRKSLVNTQNVSTDCKIIAMPILESKIQFKLFIFCNISIKQ